MVCSSEEAIGGLGRIVHQNASCRKHNISHVMVMPSKSSPSPHRNDVLTPARLEQGDRQIGMKEEKHVCGDLHIFAKNQLMQDSS